MTKRFLVSLLGSISLMLGGAAKANFAPTCSGFWLADLIAVQTNPAGAHLADPAFKLSDATGSISNVCPPPFGMGTTSANGWVEVYNDGIIAIAEGPSIVPLSVVIELLGMSGDPFADSTVGFDGSTRRGPVGSGNNLSFPSWTQTPPTRAELEALVASAPEPTTLALFGIGLAGLGLLRFRNLI